MSLIAALYIAPLRAAVLAATWLGELAACEAIPAKVSTAEWPTDVLAGQGHVIRATVV